MLKQLAPSVARVGILLNPDSSTHRRILALLVAAAPTFAVEVVAAPVHASAEIEAAVTEWGRASDYGLIVPSDPLTNSFRKSIIELAARHRLPAIYALRAAAPDGGLMSYGVDIPELFRRAATYADRIVKGDKPGDLPVQLPTRFELVINLKAAKASGFDAQADVRSLDRCSASDPIGTGLRSRRVPPIASRYWTRRSFSISVAPTEGHAVNDVHDLIHHRGRRL